MSEYLGRISIINIDPTHCTSNGRGRIFFLFLFFIYFLFIYFFFNYFYLFILFIYFFFFFLKKKKKNFDRLTPYNICNMCTYRISVSLRKFRLYDL